mgnify:CR=1 FL=1
MQLEQQETFEIKSPQLEVFGQVESKLPAPAKKQPFAAGFLAVMVLVFEGFKHMVRQRKSV